MKLFDFSFAKGWETDVQALVNAQASLRRMGAEYAKTSKWPMTMRAKEHIYHGPNKAAIVA